MEHGKFDLGKNHIPFLKVAKGGSSCANCKFLSSDKKHCGNSLFVTWYGASLLPTPVSRYCSDWYEPSAQYMEQGGKVSDSLVGKPVSPLNAERLAKKREHMEVLANSIRSLRGSVTRDLKSDDDKVRLTALVVAMIDKTAERVGNEDSALAGHLGVTGFRKKNIKIIGNKVLLDYVGKSGVDHEKSFSDKLVASVLKRAIKESPRAWVFCTPSGFRIRADRVNRYLSEYNISAKDLRGYHANKYIIDKLSAVAIPETEKDRKKLFRRALNYSAARVGHKPMTLQKHYLMPELAVTYIMDAEILNLSDFYSKGGDISDNNDDFENSEKESNFDITKKTIEDVISGKIEVRDGSAIKKATSYLKRSQGTSKMAKDSKLYKKQEESILKDYINKNNLWFSDIDLKDYVSEGSEQKVYLSNDIDVIKLNDSIFYNSWEDYLQSLLLHNYFFPDTSYELIGFHESDGVLFSVVKQPFVKATSKTDLEEVKKMMSENGFLNKKNNDYYNPELGLILEDLHDENVLTEDGVLKFIDTIFYIVPSEVATDSGEIHGPSHASGGIPMVIEPSGTPIEVEGKEYYLCKSALEDSTVYNYVDKTNKEILDDIFVTHGCEYNPDIAHADDFIVCKLATQDKELRTVSGTVSQLLDSMQSEYGGKLTSNGNKFTFGGPIAVNSASVDKSVDENGKTTFVIDDINITLDEALFISKTKQSVEQNIQVNATLQEILIDWDGYKFYPELRKLNIRFVNEYPFANSLMSFDKGMNEVFINSHKLYNINHGNDHRATGSTENRLGSSSNMLRRSIHGKLFHELQHAIQRIEGRPITISNPDYILAQLKIENRRSYMNDFDFKQWIVEKVGKPYSAIEYDYYKNIPSEKEALAVEHKINSYYNNPMEDGGPVMEGCGCNHPDDEFEGNSQIKTYVQWESVVLESVGDRNYLHVNQEGWQLTDDQLGHLLLDLQAYGNPLSSAEYLYGIDKSIYDKVTMQEGGPVRDPEKAAADFINSLSEDQLYQMAEKYKEISDDFLIEHEKNIDSLKSEREALVAKKIALDAEKNYQESFKVRYVIFEVDRKIKNETNIILCVRNSGSVASFIDKKGLAHESVPNFTHVKTDFISFDEETILIDPLPVYIPVIDEEIFAQKGYIFDVIRIGSDQYILACFGYKEYKENTSRSLDVPEFSEDFEQGYVIVTLDQLALISDYYYMKAKAVETKKANERNVRTEEYYDNLPVATREKHFAQTGYYNRLPVSVKKKVSALEWDAFTLEQKESFYKPIARKQGKRLVSKLDENHMWRSFHEMYERFINPLAVHPKPGYANAEVFDYWRKFRYMMNWKIKDIRVQRQFESDLRAAAIETSFGESNTDPVLKETYGILVKRQNGDKITPGEIDQIRKAWVNINKLFGGLVNSAKESNLKISHTGLKLVFASKAAGMYIPKMRTIAVSNKFGDNQFESILAHETAHWIDNILGEASGGRYYSDDFENKAGVIADTLRRKMNAASDSDYINSTKECFARALEQYFAIETFGDSASVIYVYTELDRKRPYFDEDHYVNKETYLSILKPLVEAFILEQKTFFKYNIVEEKPTPMETITQVEVVEIQTASLNDIPDYKLEFDQYMLKHNIKASKKAFAEKHWINAIKKANEEGLYDTALLRGDLDAITVQDLLTSAGLHVSNDVKKLVKEEHHEMKARHKEDLAAKEEEIVLIKASIPEISAQEINKEYTKEQVIETIEGLQILAETLTGKEKKDVLATIEGLEVMVETMPDKMQMGGYALYKKGSLINEYY